ncbi:hypothetical protein KFE98_11900 [bacterium SCSIO 12741]|nr:hypothetical protein KFE98_11900 [bacterium SCSIO 12741]
MTRSFSLYLLVILFFAGCQSKPKNFSDWYSDQREFPDAAKENNPDPEQRILYSSNFHLDTIYRSMMGPTEDQYFSLGEKGELFWITGYKGTVLNPDSSVAAFDFMCHNNLNFDVPRTFPWKSRTFDRVNRVFTLTPGITDIQLPEGFGIPVPGDQKLKVTFQALNHNRPELDSNFIHRIEISYYRDEDLKTPLQALAQETVWMVKQYEGPPGKCGEEPLIQVSTHLSEEDRRITQPNCGVDMLANNPQQNLDMYHDLYGRKFTGHWKIPPGVEELQMDVSDFMVMLPQNQLHYIAAHVHPFCESLELINESTGQIVSRLNMQSADSGIGLIQVEDWSSTEGMALPEKDTYVLRSRYNNTSKDTLSAMSVMYLYFSE